MRLVSKTLQIGGMTCVNCQNKIQQKLAHTKGIKKVSVSCSRGETQISFDADLISLKQIKSVIEELGYDSSPEEQSQQMKAARGIGLLLIIIALYMTLEYFGILNRLVPSQLADSSMGYGMLFVVGLLTSVHCAAMCGGINLSQCIPKGENSMAYMPSVLYNIGRVISYTLIGFLLGLIGMVLGGGENAGISIFAQGVLKIIAGFFMVIMGINMLGIFPWFRKFNLRMPKFLAVKIGGKKAVSTQPFIIGLLNGLMPCGPLQSMQIIALAAGNPITGALSMLVFSLGTVPLMLGLGSVVSALGRKFSTVVMNVGAVLVVVLGLAIFSQGGSLSGLFVHPIGTQMSADNSGSGIELVGGYQIVNSTLTLGEYPTITVREGIPVRWTIEAPAEKINGCNYVMVIQDYEIVHAFEPGENVIEFTPTSAGTIPYTCWMGMIRGSIIVTDNEA